MTKYVLNSGAVSRDKSKAQKYFAEVVVGQGEKPKILLALFAQLRENWEAGFTDLSARITELSPEGINPIFELAMPGTFEKQMHDNDIVYIPGGDDHLVMYWLRQFDLPRSWHGKVVATNSASSNAMSKHFWTCDWRQNFDGLGIVPVKFIAHFNSDYGDDNLRGPIDWQNAKAQLVKYGDADLPVHALEEGDFVVITI